MRRAALAALATAAVAGGGEVAAARGERAVTRAGPTAARGASAAACSESAVTRGGSTAARDASAAARSASAAAPGASAVTRCGEARPGAAGASATVARAAALGGASAGPLRASVELSRLSLDNSTLGRITARGWDRRVASARRYAASRPGSIAFAVRTPARIRGANLDQAYPSTSVVKAMLLVAYTRGARGRPLRADERALLGPMIRASDNDAANALFVKVGTSGLTRLARAAGMRRFTPATPIWGNSLITARDQTRFFLRLPRLLPNRHRAYALRLLRTVVPSQRWGIGQLRLRGWRVHFKGGWGSGTGRIDHQVALLTKPRQRLAVAVLTAGNGSHTVGKQTLEGVFRRLLRGLE